MNTTINLQIQSLILSVLYLRGYEAISEPFSYELTLKTFADFDEQLFDESIDLIWMEGEKIQKKLSGFIERYQVIRYEQEHKWIQLRLVSKLFLLKNIKDSQIFYHQTVLDIIRKLLKKAGYQDTQIKWFTKNEYPKLDFCICSPRENFDDFFIRLMQQNHCYYWEESDYIIIGDYFDPNKIRQETLVYRSGLGFSKANTIGKFSYHYRSGPDQIAAHYLDVQHLGSVKTDLISISPKGINRLDFFGSGHLENLARFTQAKKSFIQCSSQTADLLLGLVVNLKFPHTNEEMRIVRIKTHFDHRSGFDTEFIAIPMDSYIGIKPRRSKPCFSNLSGQILGSQNLDQRGRYTVRFDFENPYLDRNQSARLTYLKHHPGTHFPLTGHTKVLLGFLHENYDYPFILSVLPRKGDYFPVVDQNQHENRLSTMSGHHLLMHDDPEKQRVLLATYGQEQRLQMNSHAKNSTISLDSVSGPIQLSSHQDLKNQSDHVFEQVNENHLKSTESYYQTTHSTHWQSDATIRLQSDQNMEIKADQWIEMSADENMEISTRLNQIKANVAKIKSKSTQIKSNSIVIQANQSIKIQTQQAGITLCPNGRVILSAPSISGNLIYLGKVYPNAPSGQLSYYHVLKIAENALIPRLPFHDEPHVENLFWSQKIATCDETITANFTLHQFKRGDSGQLIIYQNTNHLIKIIEFRVPYDDLIQEVKVSWRPFQSMLAQEVPFKTTRPAPKHLKPNHYFFKVVINQVHSDLVEKPLMLKTDIKIQTQYINHLALPPKSFIQIQDSLGQLKRVEIEDTQVIFQKLALGEAMIKIISPDFHEPNRFFHQEVISDQRDMPYCLGVAHLPIKPKPLEICCLTPLMMCSARVEARWYPEKPIPDYFLKHLRITKRPVTIFIHGYNVPLGELTDYYDAVYVADHAVISAGTGTVVSRLTGNPVESNSKSTLYRCDKLLGKRFPIFAEKNQVPWDSNVQPTGLLNGTGAHNWSICMEDNINRAVGFDRSDYLKFKRLLHFTWSGDLGFVNYIAAEKQTQSAGQKLVDLISYLKEQGFQIDIIAHSLGNGVLAQAMNLLAEQGKDNFIEHAIMWEAAVPNNVFSSRKITKPFSQFSSKDLAFYRQKQEKNRWYLPFAYRAAKKILVLFSKNDNILGPRPHQSEAFQTIVNQHKGLNESILVEVCDFFEINSIYELATWIGEVPTYFFNSENCHHFYQEWIKHYPCDKYGKPFAKTLDEQIMPSFKNNLILRTKANSIHEIALGMIKNGWKFVSADWGEFASLTDLKSIEELLTIIDVFLQTCYEPREALGYSGIDQQDRFMRHLLSSGKLVQVDQTKILFGHSCMKIPTETLIEKIYRDWILKFIK